MTPRQALLTILVAGVCSALASCASAPPIPLQGPPPALLALAGEWDGIYTSRDTGRNGSIWFKLISGEDHAHGDVLMTPRGRTEPYYRYPATGWPGAGPPANLTQVLTIQFVHTSGGTVDGLLEPYWDPDCQCEAITTFRDDCGAIDSRERSAHVLASPVRQPDDGSHTAGASLYEEAGHD